MNILEATFDQLVDHMHRRYGKGAFHARAVYREVFSNGNADFTRMHEFSQSASLARSLTQTLGPALNPVESEHREGEVIKFVTRLKDGEMIESVVVPMATHGTVCISCQVGCRMGCRFCRTARLGLIRNLTAGEMVEQVMQAKFRYGLASMNVVFMGMGEPLDNFKNVTQAIRVMADQRGLDIAMRHITVSTAGLASGISRLGKLNWPHIRLAVSLNAPNDALRSRIMPINRNIPLAQLKKALLDFSLNKGDAFLIEYVLIKGVNDSRGHARELARYLLPLRTKVNIIPCNAGPDAGFSPPTEAHIARFCGWLVSEKLFVRRRSVKGRDIMAACGQLGCRKTGVPT